MEQEEYPKKGFRISKAFLEKPGLSIKEALTKGLLIDVSTHDGMGWCYLPMGIFM